MANLTAKQEAFVKLMTESEELARRGFDLLLKRADFEQFFDALSDAGLFEPRRNPGPVPAEEEGYLRIPYWSPLDYLVAVAKLSGERDDLELAAKVMNVVRAVSSWRNAEGRPTENYHTTRKFAEILGFVPTQAVAIQDLNFISAWLDDRFERGMVSHALDEGALPRLLSSTTPEDWDKALEIVRHCTAIRWRPAKEFGEEGKKPVSAVEDYWLKQMLRHHAKALEAKVGSKAAELFLERVHEVFSSGGRREHSRIYRPAVEDHSQNHDWHGAENRPVEGLRDALVAWCEADPDSARRFVQTLLADDLEIVRRIAIHLISGCWRQLDTLYVMLLEPRILDLDHLHELYNLLKDHFAELPDGLKAATVKAIRQIPIPDWGEDPARSLRLIQQRWLSAITGKGYAPADEWLVALQAEFGPPPEHPDFLAYSEVTVGPGPSPYSVQELSAFVQEGSLVEKLNAFEPSRVMNRRLRMARFLPGCVAEQARGWREPGSRRCPCRY